MQVVSIVTTDDAKNGKTPIKVTAFSEQSLHARCLMYVISYSYCHSTYLMAQCYCPRLTLDCHQDTTELPFSSVLCLT